MSVSIDQAARYFVWNVFNDQLTNFVRSQSLTLDYNVVNYSDHVIFDLLITDSNDVNSDNVKNSFDNYNQLFHRVYSDDNRKKYNLLYLAFINGLRGDDLCATFINENNIVFP